MLHVHVLISFVILSLGMSPSLAFSSGFSMEKSVKQACQEAQSRFASTSVSALKDCKSSDVQKRSLVDGIAEYTFSLQVGPQAEDTIRIHRVVKETNGHPISTAKAAFLIHGDVFGFDEIFLAGYSVQDGFDSQSYAIFLAQRNIDVWGLDRRFYGVSETTTDFGFMQNWNFNTEIQDVATGLAISRTLRVLSGSDGGKLFLQGWSSGSSVGYAYMNAETQFPSAFRHVKGFIPTDIAYKFAPQETVAKQKSCDRLTGLQAQFNSGIYQVNGGSGPKLAGQLAAAAPNASSPLVPGFTNLQTALFIGGFIYLVDPSFDIVPVFHQTAANVDANGIPTGLRFTSVPFFVDFLQMAKPFLNLGYRLDMETLWCGQTNSTHDDHLGQITVPVMYVGAGGGLGEYGVYTQSLLGSTDITNLVIDAEPTAERRIFDWGHSDIYLATSAATTVWTPIYNWIAAH